MIGEMNPLVHLLLGVLLGAMIGGLVGWLLALRRQVANPSDSRLENELREQLEQRAAEVAKVRGQLAETSMAYATAEARHTASEKLIAEQRELHERHLLEARQAQEKA